MEAERVRMEWEGVGDDECDGGKGRKEAPSSASPRFCQRPVESSTSARDSRGLDLSLRKDGVLDRDKKDSETVSTIESRCSGTGIEGYGLLASRLRSLSAEFANDIE